MKKYLIVFLLLLILCLSGCISLLSTQQKQICLSVTHYSKNSVPNCESQESCFNKTKEINFSKKLPVKIYNEINVYKNNIASTYYFFNKSKKNIDIINKNCDTEKPKELITELNDFFYFIGNIFKYTDYATQESIVIIKDLTIYLQKQDINLIPEEDLYNDYILFNNNLNELKKNTNRELYINNLDKEIKNLHVISEDFGFKKTYLSKTNYTDLINYYYELSLINSTDIQVPKAYPGINYLITNTNKLETLYKINTNLEKASNYNFFLVIDRLLGIEDSVHTDFIKIINRFNKNYENIYTKINDLEKIIDKEKDYLKKEDYESYLLKKRKFENKNISFGKYLFDLKNIENKINTNKIDFQEIKEFQEINLKKCNDIIKEIKKYENIYFKNQINKYEETDNYEEKILICNEMEKILNNNSCLEELEIIQNSKEIDLEEFIFLKPNNNFECIEIIQTINYKLKSDKDVVYINNIIENNKKILLNIQINEIDVDLEYQLNQISEKITDDSRLQNYIKKINYKQIIEQEISIFHELEEIVKNIVSTNKYDFEFIQDKYYLVVNNDFDLILENINLKRIEDTETKSKDKQLGVKQKEFMITKLFPNLNYFEIEIINNKIIEKNIINLTLEEALINLNIKNSVNNFWDNIILNNKILVIYADTEYFINDDLILKYITKENININYLEKILNINNIQEDIEQLTTDVFIINKQFDIKNIFEENISNTNINLIEINKDDEVIIKENNQLKNFENIDDKLYILIDLKKEETKQYNIQILKNKDSVYSDIININLIINELKNSNFEDIKKEINNSKFDILDPNKINYTFDEIKAYYLLENEISNINNLEKNNKLIENKFIELYHELMEISSEEEKIILKEINLNKYKNITNSYYELEKIKFKKTQSEKEKKEKIIKDNIEHKQKIETQIYALENSDKKDELIKKLQDIKIEEDNNKLFTEIEIQIDNYSKIKSKEIYNLLIELEDYKQNSKIEELLDKVIWLYEDYSLKDVYDLNYYPTITLKDAERIKKKSEFLDTVTYNNLYYNFIEKYENKDYLEASTYIDTPTLKRLEEIKTEHKLLEKGYEQIKDDAKQLLNKFIELNKNDDSINSIVTQAMDYFDNEKYINTIILIKNNLDLETSKNTSGKKQTIIALLFLIILVGLYVTLKNKNKKQKIKKFDKKKKILRNN